MEKYGYKFSFGPWNIHEGADPFGPTVRPSVPFAEKLTALKEMGYDAMQFHDDDVVPGLEDMAPGEVAAAAREMKQVLDDHGLAAEFVAPRLWELPALADGGFTANDPAVRSAAIDRARQCADIAREVGCDLVVLWLAREGTYLRESKDARRATEQLVEAVDAILAHDAGIRVALEPKPNEPMDIAYMPTIGHALTIAAHSSDPARVGALVESAHAVLAGLDPSDEMAFALAFDSLYSVHLNDQNGLKFDQDRSFGSVDLRRAFNQVRVLDEAAYYQKGMVGMDVKAIRTQPAELATRHLENSLKLFLRLVGVVRSLDREQMAELVAARDYESLDWLVLDALMGG